MEVLRGKREDTKLFVYENYSYHLDKRSGHTYRCSRRRTNKCPGVLIQNGDTYHLKKQHDHPHQSLHLMTTKLKQEMKDVAKESYMTNKQIFDSVSRAHADAAVHLTYNSIKSSLARQKLKQRPPLPDNLQLLREALETYQPLKNFYKGAAVSEMGEIALIFSTDILLQALSDSSEIYVDGTFSVLPRTPHIAQLYTIHIRYFDTGIATIFILCQSRTASLYKAIWEKIFELVPEVRSNITFIMSDYETAARSAMRKIFPTANIQLCWFHFNQALQRKWHNLGLNLAPSDLLHMAQTLPLLPCEYFEEAFDILETEANKISITFPTLLFIAYMRRTWLPIASEISTFGCPVRTNNLVESFNHTAAIKLGKTHPNLWLFLENCLKLLTDQELDYGRLKLGHRIKRRKTQAAKNRDRIILEAQNDLVNKKLPLKQFLRLFNRSLNQHGHQENHLIEDNKVEERRTLRELKVVLKKIDVKLLKKRKQRILRI